MLSQTPRYLPLLALLLMEPLLPTQTYEVFLNEDGQLRWRGMEGDTQVVLDKEPQTGWWDRFMAGFYRTLPIRGQL